MQIKRLERNKIMMLCKRGNMECVKLEICIYEIKSICYNNLNILILEL